MSGSLFSFNHLSVMEDLQLLLGKGKTVPQHTYGGTGGYSFCSFMTLALDGVSGQRHASAMLYPWGKDPRYPLDRRLGGPQSRSGRRG
jgi:hypothetical protein